MRKLVLLAMLAATTAHAENYAGYKAAGTQHALRYHTSAAMVPGSTYSAALLSARMQSFTVTTQRTGRSTQQVTVFRSAAAPRPVKALPLSDYTHKTPAPRGQSAWRMAHVARLATCNPFAHVQASTPLLGCQ